MDTRDLSDPAVRKEIEDAAVRGARTRLGLLLLGLVALALVALPAWLALALR